MKRLDRYILTSFIGPFFGILLLVVFILMMQFLWVYIDELVGKGLSFTVILEFMGWGGATLLPLSLPLATLLASVMTIGQLSENSELTAIKASGVSLARVMVPLLGASLLICVAAFFAANDLVPLAFNKIFTLRDDIGKTKQEINIPTGSFYDGIEGYTLRVDSRNRETGMMYGVMVYDNTRRGSQSLTLADSAMMKMSKAKDYLTFRMYNGINYQETNTMRYRDTTLQLQSLDFTLQEMVIPLKNYAFEKSGDARFGDQVKAMNLKQLKHGKDSVVTLRDSARTKQLSSFMALRTLRYAAQLDTASHFDRKYPMKYPDPLTWDSIADERYACDKAIDQIKETVTTLKNNGNEVYSYLWFLRRTDVELLKKFAGALACLLMFLIGTPLGAFVNRKNGLGASAIIAVLFFVLYWVVDITGVKLARDGAASPPTGVFISTAVLLPIGIYLSYKAIRDSAVISTEGFSIAWKQFLGKIKRFFRKPGIVYMGTPEFAVAPLEALIKAGYKISAVVTVPDKPSGRGLKMNESAVKKYAVEHGLKVLQPVKLKDTAFLDELRALKADLFVVVGFRMLPQEVWSMPPLGTFNLHAALLPQYRGAAPINWAVINGERMTGVTTFLIDKDIDTGGIILRQEMRIGPEDTAGDVHDALMPIGAKLVVDTVEGLLDRNVETRVQRSFIQGMEVLKPAPKLSRELCHIDWDAPASEIYNLIRGLSPYPAAFTELTREGTEPVQLKVFKAAVAGSGTVRALCPGGLPAPGTVVSDGKKTLGITASDGVVLLKDVQLAGKKRMETAAFLAGFRDIASFGTTAGTAYSIVQSVRGSEGK